ncbi:O-methyltransferase-domain-containing protein, partial [Cyathus striatus]
RVLRVLATHHMFTVTESSPDLFKNNRLSSLLDTMKLVEDINPVHKHVGTPGMAALMEHTSSDPVMGHSESHEHTPLAVCCISDKKAPFEWYEEPENEYRLHRFAAAMEGSARLDPPNAILQGRYKWESLTSNSTVVNVGGGIGHTTLQLLQNRGDLLYIVQDRPAVVTQAKHFWDTNNPKAEAQGTVSLMAHDFFTAQPVKGAAIYLLRMIVHDYGKKKAVSILQHIRDAASKNSKLLLVEQIVLYACIDMPIGDGISGAQQLLPPAPLLTNLGKASAVPYLGDFQVSGDICMFCANGGEERTLGTFIDLTKSSGWKIVEVITVPGSLHRHIVAISA